MIKFESKTTHCFNATLRSGQEVKLSVTLLSQRSTHPYDKVGQLHAMDAHGASTFVDLTELEAEAVLFRALTPLNLTVTPDSLVHESEYSVSALEDMHLIGYPGQASWIFDTTVADADNVVEALCVEALMSKTTSSKPSNHSQPDKPSVFALLHDCYNRLKDISPDSQFIDRYQVSAVKNALDAHFKDWNALLANNEPHMIAYALHVDGMTAGQYDLAEWHNNSQTHPHPLFSRDNWIKTVISGNNDGYWEWVSSQLRGISVEDALKLLKSS